jgi:hypothetical protein
MVVQQRPFPPDTPAANATARNDQRPADSIRTTTSYA